eukprot:1844634-Pyramimonas_sp.AAC.1
MRSAQGREPHFENRVRSILEAVASFKLQGRSWRESLRRNARPSLRTCPVVPQGGVIHKEKE